MLQLDVILGWDRRSKVVCKAYLGSLHGARITDCVSKGIERLHQWFV